MLGGFPPARGGTGARCSRRPRCICVSARGPSKAGSPRNDFRTKDGLRRLGGLICFHMPTLRERDDLRRNYVSPAGGLARVRPFRFYHSRKPSAGTSTVNGMPSFCSSLVASDAVSIPISGYRMLRFRILSCGMYRAELGISLQ